MQLSSRAIQVASILINSSEPKTTAELANQFQVSVRTIKYDLQTIKNWCRENRFDYVAQRGQGIVIEVTEQQRHQAQQLLTNHGSQIYETPTERVNSLLLILLLSAGYNTTQQLENKLQVSKSTIISDLQNVDHYIQGFHVKLERKHYYGYRLIGYEADLRNLFEFTLQNHITSSDLTRTITYINQGRKIDAFAVDYGLNEELQSILSNVVKLLGSVTITHSKMKYSDAHVLSILIRTSIMVARLSLNHPINSYKMLTPEIQHEVADKLEYQLFKKVCSQYDFQLLEDEYTYVNGREEQELNGKSIAKLTRTMIGQVATDTHEPFQRDERIFINLFSHLMSKLNGRYKYVSEYNPFVPDIKRDYPDLFKAVYRASQQLISPDPTIVNDSFVAFLTLHFAVALKRLNNETDKVRIVYVCATGLGVTNLIQQQVSEQIANVEIADFTSLIDAPATIAQAKPDLVVSIFPLTSDDVPVIQVNPMPTADDITRIKEAVAKLLEKNPNDLATSTKQILASQDFETENREQTILGFQIYVAIRDDLKELIQPAFNDAFMLHTMLVVHRVRFKRQYQGMKLSSNLRTVYAKEIEQIRSEFKAHDLIVNDSEIAGFIQYFSLSKRK